MAFINEDFKSLAAVLINATQHPGNTTDPAEIRAAVEDIARLFDDLDQKLERKSQVLFTLEQSFERLQSQVDRMGRGDR